QFESVRTQRGRDGVAHADLLKILRGGLIPMAAAIVGLDGLDSDESIERLRVGLLDISAASGARWSVGALDEIVSSGIASKQDFVRDYFQPAWRRRQKLVQDVDAGRRDRA